MATVDTVWYVNYGNGSSTGYYAVPVFAINTAYTVGQIIRQLATPSVGSERLFICIIAGTTGASEATWTNTRGAKTVQGTATFQECTGNASVNGDLTNTTAYATIASTSVSLGQIVKNSSNSYYFICSTSGTAGASEPSWNTVTGATTVSGATWTCIGPVGNFTAWGAPHSRIRNAASSSWASPGNNIYVGDNHAETLTAASAFAITSNSSISSSALPLKIYSVDHTVVNPSSADIMSGAQLISPAGYGVEAVYNSTIHVIFYNMKFVASSGSSVGSVLINDTNTGRLIFENCTFQINNTNTGSSISLTAGTSPCDVILRNCTMQFGATAQGLKTLGGTVRWYDSATPVSGTIPTNLFIDMRQSRVILDGVDLSAMGSNTLVASVAYWSDITFRNCKLGSGSIGNGPTVPIGAVDLIVSDNAATGYRQERKTYAGALTTETTIVRTGGASDGLQTIAWKVVTTANCSWLSPFECFPIAIWNNNTNTNVTVTVYGIWGSASVPNNDEIWIEVGYLGSASTPIETNNTSNTKANALTANSAQTSDSSTWGGSTTPFKMSVTLSSPKPQIAGNIYVFVRCGKPSTTFYIDPQIILS